ncbi:hypothetical protein B4U80_14663, partial [Leptotrombidium deliense]
YYLMVRKQQELHQFVKLGVLIAIKRMIAEKNGAVKQLGYSIDTTIQNTVEFNRTEVAEFLLNSDSDDAEVLQIIVDHKVDVTIVNQYGNFTLHVGIIHASLECVKILLQKNIKLN